MKTYDLTGQVFERLTVIEKDIERSKQTRRSFWKCKCSCGNPKILSVYGNHLKTGAIRSCGCIKIEDLTGQIFGFLEPIKIDWERSGKGNSAYWLCKCHKCNREELKSVSAQNLKNKHSTTCGCISNLSLGEEKLKKILTELDIPFKTQYKYDKCRGKNNAPLRFDFLITYQNRDILIEYQGEQHYKIISNWGGEDGLKQRQNRDKIKEMFCLENKIHLIIIPYTDFNKINKEYLLNKIKNIALID